MTSLSTLKEKIETLNKELKDGFSKALKTETDQLFESYPMLQSITWAQYTPYFNDGEPCEFSAHLDDPGYTLVDGDNELEVRNYESCVVTWGDNGRLPEPKLTEDAEHFFTSVKQAKEFEEKLNEFTSQLWAFESTLQRVIGEGLVILTRDGIDLEDYDHD